MKLNVTVKANDGRYVRVTSVQAKSIEALANIRKGGCASVIGYMPSSDWIERPTHDIQLITNFSTQNLYKRRLASLEDIHFKDVVHNIIDDSELAAKSILENLEIFNQRKQMLIDSLQKSLDNDRSDAHRQAHDRCYAYIGSVKIHLQTEKIDGIKQPVEDEDGNVFCESIMVPYLELKVTERVPGKRKVVNSGPPVRMGKLIERCLNKRSVVYKTLSLKEDNFEAFRVDRQEFLPEDVATYGDILNT